jgi:hypothetical protein
MTRIIDKQIDAYLTEYPKIFIKSYWGNGNINIRDNLTDVANNRNDFIKEFNIKKWYDVPVTYDLLLNMRNTPRFDHTEYYQTIDKEIIVISSPYGIEEEFINFGFSEYKQLYSRVATTYLIKFDTSKSIKDYIKKHNLAFYEKSC